MLPRRRLIVSIATRSFSAYSPTYIHPIFRPSDQDKLKEDGEWERHTFLPVRPLGNEQNASVFYDGVLEKFINHVMREGEKEKARGLLEKAFAHIKRIQLGRLRKDPTSPLTVNPYRLLHLAIQNARPLLETTPIKRGGHTYQVPQPIRERAQVAIAMKWLVEAGKEKEGDERFWRQLAREIVECAEGQGKVIKRKQDQHRLCEANRAYAHYRWS